MSHIRTGKARPWVWTALTSSLLLCLVGSAHPAGAASIMFDDFTVAQGDGPSTAGDLIHARLDFDLSTGAYSATWMAEASRPFNGDIQFFLNLIDETIDPIALASITSILASFPGTSGATTLSSTGVEADLTRWSVGDQIVNAGSGFNFGFNSGVQDLNLPNPNNRDILFQTSATVVPEASLAALLALGLVLASGVPGLRRGDARVNDVQGR